jgi:seryl-tRNA(Sec) selenium transferase
MISYAVTIQPREMSCETMMEKMRHFDVPVIGHIKEDKVWLDMRTVMPEDVEILKNCIVKIMR